MKLYQIKDFTPDFILGDGVVSKITKNKSTPWEDVKYSSILADITSADLDVLYAMRSNEKLLQPMLSDINMFDTVCDKLGKILIPMWYKYADTYIQDYNIIDNYHILEVESTDTLNTVDRNKSGETITSGTTADEKSSQLTSNDTTQTSVYGYNSEDPTNSNKIDETRSDTQTTENNIQKNETITDTETTSENGSRNEDRNLSRHGNIGVTTTQKMLQEERELLVENFIEYVFKNIDKYLTIPVY